MRLRYACPHARPTGWNRKEIERHETKKDTQEGVKCPYACTYVIVTDITGIRANFTQGELQLIGVIVTDE